MIDPYAKVNEKIRSRRRAQGRRDNEHDALIRAASHELGAATEAALGLVFDVMERVGLRYLEEAARTGATRRFRWAPDAVRGVRFASSRLPGASGRAVSMSSEVALRAGLSVIRELRRRLESTRREATSGEDRSRRRPKPSTAGVRTPAPRTRAAPAPKTTRGRAGRRPARDTAAAPREAE